MQKHGQRGLRTKEYTAWGHMVQRCTNPNHPRYADYGGRGIKICDRWLKFEHFLEDVGVAPSSKHSIDRYPNNDGDYELGNFRWATTQEQNSNRRTVKIINGKTLTEWAKILGGNRTMVVSRLKDGWPEDLAVSAPLKKSMQRSSKMPNEQNDHKQKS